MVVITRIVDGNSKVATSSIASRDFGLGATTIFILILALGGVLCVVVAAAIVVFEH